MADIKISELPVAASVSDADVLVVNQGGITKQAQRSLVRNTGTVTSVVAGTGLTGGTITGSGTIALQTSGVAAGTFGSSQQIPVITVDQYGRTTLATTQQISISTQQLGVIPVSKGGTGATSEVAALANLGAGTVSAVTAGAGLTGGTITVSGTIALATANANTGSFGSTNQIPVITVDQYGRITSAQQVALVAGTVTSITAGTGLAGGTITGSGTLSVTYGTSPSTACEGDDPRLFDPRTPSGNAGGDLSGTYPSPNVKAINGTALSSLQTGLLKNTTITGIPSIAVAGSDYLAPVMDVQTFSTSGTWTKPAGARAVKVQLWSGGGGGGSGRKGLAGTVRTAGAGGGSGGYYETTLLASSLAATEIITIGLGGGGGLSQTTNSSNGLGGLQGGTTSFGSLVILPGANGGAGGTNTQAFGGGGSVNGIAGSGNSATGGSGSAGAPSTTGSSATQASGSGASGGGITSTDSASTGASGGRYNLLNFAGGTLGAVSGNGGNGTSIAALPTNGSPCGASGGGGGGSSTTTNAGVGGNGGFPAGGAGGGGAALDGVGNSGAGGSGGSGAAIITTYF